jgi:hypothetical protein
VKDQEQTMAHRWRAFVAGISCVAALAVNTSQAQSQSAPVPTKQLGKAVVEYQDKTIQLVAAYYYSQRNHDSRWLMIETALSTAKDDAIKRTAIALRTPQGLEIPLATQRQVNDDIADVQRLLQNSSVVSHDVPSYFTQGIVEPMGLFTLPFGPVVHNSFVVDRDRVAAGPFLFESPSGTWENGTYALILRHGEGTAELPIVLE